MFTHTHLPEPTRIDERPANRLLASLAASDFQQIRPHLRTIALAPRQSLHKQGDRIRYVYFPNGGVVSMTSLLPDGTMVEAAAIGDDGVVGLEALFGDDTVSACETIVQVPISGNSAERMTVADFRHALQTCVTFDRAVTRYTQTVYAMMARLMACNAHHPVEERCARWLLTMHDRMHGKEFQLSHEFLAAMLGVRRQSVSIVAGRLRNAGLIRYVYGRVTVLDREGLLAAACDCYPLLAQLYIGMSVGRSVTA